MKFKLDENFASRTVEVFRANGHDIQTVRDKRLGGAGDARLYKACCAEKRCLVTLDMDFSDPIRFDPVECGGIVILRAPVNPSLRLLTIMTQAFLGMTGSMPIDGALWIVEPNRIRIHRPGV